MGAAVVLLVTALSITVVIGVFRSAASPVDEVPLGEQSPGGVAAIESPAIYVHVFGAVQHPGLYRFEGPTRVVDVVAAAGGFAKSADHDGVNLAREVSDGEHLKVPLVGEEPSAADEPSDARVNLNTADEATLDTLPRIGPALAGRIIAWREDNGRFTSVEDLLAVPGIGEKMLASLRELVRV